MSLDLIKIVNSSPRLNVEPTLKICVCMCVKLLVGQVTAELTSTAQDLGQSGGGIHCHG